MTASMIHVTKRVTPGSDKQPCFAGLCKAFFLCRMNHMLSFSPQMAVDYVDGQNNKGYVGALFQSNPVLEATTQAQRDGFLPHSHPTRKVRVPDNYVSEHDKAQQRAEAKRAKQQARMKGKKGEVAFEEQVSIRYVILKRTAFSLGGLDMSGRSVVCYIA